MNILVQLMKSWNKKLKLEIKLGINLGIKME